MKIKFLATGNAPTHYSFAGETVTAHVNVISEDFDLSAISVGDKVTSVSVDTLDLNSGHILRDAYRDESGELYITLCQRVGPGHWSESDWMDVSDYNSDAIQVNFDSTKDFSGQPWAQTQLGKVIPV